MKKFLLLPLIIFLIIVSGMVWFWKSSQPVSSKDSTIAVVIKKGSSASDIGVVLKEKAIIRSSLAFKIYIQATGKQKSILAGEYTLNSKDSMFKIVEELSKGPSLIWVTIPEGLRSEEIAQRFISAFNLDSASAQSFKKEFLEAAADKEGYLFPDTYLLAKTTTATNVVKLLTLTFDKKMDAQLQAQIDKGSLSLSQTMILASLVERETKTEDERPIVAGILIKRFEEGWPLQVDATLQYALANIKYDAISDDLSKIKWWQPATSEDKKVKSSYNTYLNAGLPPTPIANPGLSSIKSVIYPQDSDYWYYLHDSEGNIHYAKTLQEHNQNISKYL